MSGVTKRGLPRQRVAPGASLSERIYLHTDRSGACWVWTACTDTNGYGRLALDGKLRYAHRVSYVAFVGAIPADREVDHLCRNRACCNPAHLEAVDASTNVRRGMSAGAIALRRDFCFYGVHSYAEFGFHDKQGRRKCRQCNRDYVLLWKRTPHAERMRRKHSGEKVVDLAAYYAEQAAA